MLPTRSHWQSWSPLEKTAYLAQIAAALALLPTVLFAWLSFREARLAREDQVRYFQAEKAPLLRLESLTERDGLLIANVVNTGESLARGVNFWFRIANPPKKCDVAVSVNDQDTNVPLIERGQTANFIVAAVGQFKEQCGVTLGPFSYRQGRNYSMEKDPPYLELLIVWIDIGRQEHAVKYEIDVKQ